MATLTSREIVNEIINGDGWYPGDTTRVVKIVEYTDQAGETAWGIIYDGER